MDVRDSAKFRIYKIHSPISLIFNGQIFYYDIFPFAIYKTQHPFSQWEYLKTYETESDLGTLAHSKPETLVWANYDIYNEDNKITVQRTGPQLIEGLKLNLPSPRSSLLLRYSPAE